MQRKRAGSNVEFVEPALSSPVFEDRALPVVCPGLEAFVTTFSYIHMVAFVRRRIVPIASFAGESHRTRIEL